MDKEEKIRIGQFYSALPAPTIIAFPSTAGTQLALPASTSQPSTEPVIVPVPQSADATKYLDDICLNELVDNFVNSNVFHTAMQTNQINPTVVANVNLLST